jgi:hypothetical protein
MMEIYERCNSFRALHYVYNYNSDEAVRPRLARGYPTTLRKEKRSAGAMVLIKSCSNGEKGFPIMSSLQLYTSRSSKLLVAILALRDLG